MKKPSVYVLLATYNGEQFLSELIESIYGMNIPGDETFNLLVRDDASQDETKNILTNFVKKFTRFKVIQDRLGKLGASENFSCLLQAAYESRAEYIIFSDQDDVWLANKFLLQMDKMQELEQSFTDAPLLVHSDMEVVDSSLGMIAPSFMGHQGIKHEEDPLPILLAQNFVTGCTVLANRQLLDVALPIPKEALMHDWWLALCAVVFGHIGYIDKPLLKYRQHANNEVGVKHFGDFINPFTGKWKKRWFEGRDNLFQSMKQAQALAERIREHDPENPHLDLVESYVSLQFMSPLKRIKRLRDLGVHAQSSPRQALLLSRLLLTAKAHHA